MAESSGLDSGASQVDAMGQDERREVMSHSYGPSRKSQFLFFAAVAGVAILVIGGFFAAVAAFDQPADSYPDKAPWSDADAQQAPARNPSNPCGEPGDPYPAAADSPCKPIAGITAEPDSARAGEPLGASGGS